ncbi:MAG: MATE family efflux transporter [Lachnospiraceae bacterium]|nr:MATE family efflux transporter [Lachnospiraceae bacterium]
MKETNQDFTTGSIPVKMVRFMLPILAALVLQAMYSAVDLMIVGHFGTTAGISGIATGSNVMNLFTFFTANIAVGVTVLLGRYLGEHREDRIGKLIGGAVVFFAVLSLLFSVIMFVFARPIAGIMQAPEEAVELTVQYIRICAVGFIFVVFYNFISSVMRGMGNSKLPLIFVAIACIVNIVGDLVLVAGFHMNVVGAAIATIFAQAVSVVLSVIIIFKQKLPFTIGKRDFRLNEEVKLFFFIGLPLGFQEILTNGTFLALCAFVNRMGLDCSSGYGVAQKIQAFVMLIPVAIMQSIASFVAQNVGAKREDRGISALRWSMGIGVLIGLFVAVGIFFRGDIVAEIFSDDSAVIARAFEFMKGFAPEAFLTSVLFSFMGYFNAHSKSFFVMLMGILQSLIVRLPLSYYMSIRPNANLTGVGLAAPTATVFGILLGIVYYLYLRKKKVIVIENRP